MILGSKIHNGKFLIFIELKEFKKLSREQQKTALLHEYTYNTMNLPVLHEVYKKHKDEKETTKLLVYLKDLFNPSKLQKAME